MALRLVRLDSGGVCRPAASLVNEPASSSDRYPCITCSAAFSSGVATAKRGSASCSATVEKRCRPSRPSLDEKRRTLCRSVPLGNESSSRATAAVFVRPVCFVSDERKVNSPPSLSMTSGTCTPSEQTAVIACRCFDRSGADTCRKYDWGMLAKNQGTSRADALCCNVASSAITAVESGTEMMPEER